MNPDDLRPQFQNIEINGVDRWQLYFRLQELGIPCRCASNEPLQICVTNAIAVVQVWSVFKHVAMHRRELVQWLDRCWSS